MEPNKIYGLVGKNISYSFSKNYFNNKFQQLGIEDSKYVNFDLPDLSHFKELLKNQHISGLNVTIPYKEKILNYLDNIDPIALQIGAVNTIKISSENKLIGYNTDCFGFTQSILPLLKAHHTKALILGTGGAAKAVAYSLKNLNIDFKYVSRSAEHRTITYDQLSKETMKEHLIIINCTPLGTFPHIHQKPDIPYQHLTSNHLLYDLIYNPSETSFLQQGKQHNCTLINGYEMLVLQAEKSYEIWTTNK